MLWCDNNFSFSSFFFLFILFIYLFLIKHFWYACRQFYTHKAQRWVCKHRRLHYLRVLKGRNKGLWMLWSEQMKKKSTDTHFFRCLCKNNDWLTFQTCPFSVLELCRNWPYPRLGSSDTSEGWCNKGWHLMSRQSEEIYQHIMFRRICSGHPLNPTVYRAMGFAEVYFILLILHKT